MRGIDMRDLFEEMLKPADKLTMVTRALLAIWLGVVLVEVGVWLAIWIFSGDLEAPWFLWSVLVGGVIVAGFHLAGRKRRR
jgi:hypothetical protein